MNDRYASVFANGQTPVTATASELLAWYDRHRRSLPWRAKPGEMAEPYRVWLSEIMLQQTTVAAAKPYFERFLARFPDVMALAEAPSEAVMQAWAGLGYYSRARNLHACAKVVAMQHGGLFPGDEAGLIALPGIGPYTAAAIAAIAFNQRAAAVDGNVERVMSRLMRLEVPLPAARPAIRAATLALVPEARPGDFAQGLMDLGATICTPRSPACQICPWNASCRARAAGDAADFPRKVRKKSGATRHGAAFVVLRADGAILLRTRPPRGLLGGMAEVPTGEWLAGSGLVELPDNPPLAADWQRLPVRVRHVFTHFPLELTVFVARAGSGTAAPDGMRFTRLAELDTEPLSGLMQKVAAAGMAALQA